MATTFRKPKIDKKIDPDAADKLAEELADKPYDQPKRQPESSEELQPLQFKIPRNLHREFKMSATANGMKMVDFFKLIYDEYKKNNN